MVNLSATVPPNDRIRIRYKVTSGTLLEQHLDAIAEKINAAWRSNRDALVFSPAVAPTAGGMNLLGLSQDLYTSLDVKTINALRPITWDAYLAPYRTITPGLLGALFGGLENAVAITLDDVRELQPGEFGTQSGAASRTQETGAAAAKSRAAAAANPLSSLQNLARTVAGRVTLLIVLVLIVVLVVQFGPQLAAVVKRLTSKRG